MQNSRPFYSKYGEFFIALMILICIFSIATYLGKDGWGEQSTKGIGKPSRWCEMTQPGLVREPINTFSNLGFIVIGLLILIQIGRDESRATQSTNNPIIGRDLYAQFYGIAVIFLGPGSMAMHATHTNWGGWIDRVSMVCYITFPVCYNLARAFKWSKKTFSIVYLITNIAIATNMAMTTFLDLGFRHDFFGTFIGFWIVTELAICFPNSPRFYMLIPALLDISLRGASYTLILWVALAAVPISWNNPNIKRRYLPWFWVGNTLFVVAFIIWHTGDRRHAWCNPTSLIQAHAAWHIMTAFSAGAFYLYFRTENTT